MHTVRRLEFLKGQLDCLHSFNFPIWLAGLGWFLTAKNARSFRVFGWGYLFMLVSLLVIKSKSYYLVPVYTFLLAGGTVAIEAWVNQHGLRRLKLVLPAILVAGGLLVAPTVLPVLPIENIDARIAAATVGLVRRPPGAAQYFRDYLGWENQARVVAEVFHRFSAEEQTNCIIFADQESEAGAIDFYGRALGLPSATCVQMNYYFWGPPTKTGPVIAFGVSLDNLAPYWGHIQRAATIRCPEASPTEQVRSGLCLPEASS